MIGDGDDLPTRSADDDDIESAIAIDIPAPEFETADVPPCSKAQPVTPIREIGNDIRAG